MQEQTAAGEWCHSCSVVVEVFQAHAITPSPASSGGGSLVAAADQYLLYLREGSALGLEDDVVGEECARQAVKREEREHGVHPYVHAHRAVQLRTGQNKLCHSLL